MSLLIDPTPGDIIPALEDDVVGLQTRSQVVPSRHHEIVLALQVCHGRLETVSISVQPHENDNEDVPHEDGDTGEDDGESVQHVLRLAM